MTNWWRIGSCGWNLPGCWALPYEIMNIELSHRIARVCVCSSESTILWTPVSQVISLNPTFNRVCFRCDFSLQSILSKFVHLTMLQHDQNTRLVLYLHSNWLSFILFRQNGNHRSTLYLRVHTLTTPVLSPRATFDWSLFVYQSSTRHHNNVRVSQRFRYPMSMQSDHIPDQSHPNEP